MMTFTTQHARLSQLKIAFKKILKTASRNEVIRREMRKLYRRSDNHYFKNRDFRADIKNSIWVHGLLYKTRDILSMGFLAIKQNTKYHISHMPVYGMHSDAHTLLKDARERWNAKTIVLGKRSLYERKYDELLEVHQAHKKTRRKPPSSFLPEAEPLSFWDSLPPDCKNLIMHYRLCIKTAQRITHTLRRTNAEDTTVALHCVEDVSPSFWLMTNEKRLRCSKIRKNIYNYNLAALRIQEQFRRLQMKEWCGERWFWREKIIFEVEKMVEAAMEMERWQKLFPIVKKLVKDFELAQEEYSKERFKMLVPVWVRGEEMDDIRWSLWEKPDLFEKNFHKIKGVLISKVCPAGTKKKLSYEDIDPITLQEGLTSCMDWTRNSANDNKCNCGW